MNLIFVSIFIVVTIFIFGISKAICDVSECCFNNSKLAKLNPLFWDKHKSWKNKWKGGVAANGEKFFGSSTFLVWITDAWHLFNMLSYLSLFIAGYLTATYLDKWYLVIIPFPFGLMIFELIYKYLKN